MAARHMQAAVSDGIATLSLDRPPLNILHIPLLAEFAELLEKLSADPDVRALILRAEGKRFSAGVDVADHTHDKVGEMIPLFHDVCSKLVQFPTPTIAAAQGDALGGGCELVICCDLAVLAQEARIGQPEIQLAVFAPVAALRLVDLVGYRVAADMLLTGRLLSAEEARQAGLVNAVLPAAEVDAWALEKASALSKLSRSAQLLNKQALRHGFRRGAEGLSEVESIYLQDLMQTEDVYEGLAAFGEKRTPVWAHR